MLPERKESEATGRIARIYDEIRTLWRVPYVSSMQRYLATQGDWLPWAWEILAPVFRSHQPQLRGWRIATEIEVAPLPAISGPVAQVFGLAPEDVATIRDIANGFQRVSPVNLMMGGMLRRVLERSDELGRAAEPLPERSAGAMPAPLPAPPPLPDFDAMAPALRVALDELAIDMADERFVPGLYRAMADWPIYCAHLVTVLRPRFDDPATRAALGTVAARIDAAAGVLAAHLPRVACPFPAHEVRAVLDAIAQYRTTSPQMIVFGRLIARSLPE